MSTIRNTIEQSLSAQGVSSRDYSRYAEPVVAALEEREESIKQGLASYAADRGLSASDTQSLFVTVGLSEPEPEPEVETTQSEATEGGLEALVASLAQQVQALVSAAGRHGIRV